MYFLKHWRAGILGILGSLLAGYLIVIQIDFDVLREAVTTARYEYVVPCIVLLLIGLVTRAMRWRLLLSDSLPLGRAFSIMNVAYLVNGVMPLRIGEVARAYLASRVQPPIPATAIVEYNHC